MTVPTCTTGQVVGDKDPENLGRVKLRVPHLLGETATVWAPVMAAYGRTGSAKPKVGDHVVVALIDGSPDQLVVLGKLPR